MLLRPVDKRDEHRKLHTSPEAGTTVQKAINSLSPAKRSTLCANLRTRFESAEPYSDEKEESDEESDETSCNNATEEE